MKFRYVFMIIFLLLISGCSNDQFSYESNNFDDNNVTNGASSNGMVNGSSSSGVSKSSSSGSSGMSSNSDKVFYTGNLSSNNIVLNKKDFPQELGSFKLVDISDKSTTDKIRVVLNYKNINGTKLDINLIKLNNKNLLISELSKFNFSSLNNNYISQGEYLFLVYGKFDYITANIEFGLDGDYLSSWVNSNFKRDNSFDKLIKVSKKYDTVNDYISSYKKEIIKKVKNADVSGSKFSVEILYGNSVYIKNKGNFVKIDSLSIKDDKGNLVCDKKYNVGLLANNINEVKLSDCKIKLNNVYSVILVTNENVYQEKELSHGSSLNEDELELPPTPPELSKNSSLTPISNNESGFEHINETQDSKTIVLGDLESTNVILNGVSYNIRIESISQQSAKIVVNGEPVEVQIDSMGEVAGIYIYINDLTYSGRASVKSYIELIVSNKEIENGNFFCSDSGSNVIGYLTGSDDTVSSVSDSCSDENTKLDYYCANDDKTISKQYINCPYGCSNGECRICSVKEENKLSNTFNLGEGDVFNLNTSNGPYPIEVLSVASDKVLLKVGSETKTYDSCETFESNGIKFQINDLVQSLRDGVKSYVEFGYDYINSGSSSINSSGSSSSSSSSQETNFELTDSFNFWKDQSSHDYSTFGDVSSGAYVCFDNGSFASNPNYIGNPDPEYNTLRLGNCGLTNESSVSVVLDVLKNSSKIQLKIKEATGYNQFDLYLDDIYYGHFNTVSRCQYTFLNFNNLMNLTTDGKIKVTIADGAPGSCLGDMQISDLKIYSSY